MFDFAPLPRAVGWLFFALVACFPVGLVTLGIVHATTGRTYTLDFLGVYPPWVFGAAALALVVDFFRRLGSGALTSSEVTGYRVAGLFATLGTVIGLSALPDHPTWVPILVALGCLVALLGAGRGEARSGDRSGVGGAD